MVSVGIDMIEIERIEKCMKREGFLNKFFGEEEILQLKSKKFIIQSVAANFCAKEAFSKAIGTGIRRFKLREVEILRNEMGKPYIKLTGDAFDIAASNGYKFDVSLTHTKQFASAVVVCEKVGDDKMEIIRNYEYIQSINMDMVRKKLPFRSAFAHKGTFGTLVAVCGSVGMAGAATMCISSAVRCGVGLVRAVVPKGIYDIVAKQVVEAVYVLADENSDGTIGLSEVDKILNCLKKSTACVVGCGLGWNKDIKEILENIIKNCKIPLLIDADGINVLSENIDVLKEKQSEIVITPHVGEMARLMGVSTDEINRNRLSYAKQLAQKYEITVVLKGHNTIISDKEGNLFMNNTGNCGMAKGGSGDVLSGMIGAFLAQGLSGIDAAVCGVHLHGVAGDKCSEKLSKTAMLPTDMINELPNLFLEIE